MVKVGDYTLHKTKENAQKLAKEIRKKGYLVRVTLTPKHYRNNKLPYELAIVGKKQVRVQKKKNLLDKLLG